MECFLSIIGEDAQDIERKYLGNWRGILPTRIIVLVNEPPKFEDDSGALREKFIVSEIKVDFWGREDIQLTDKLLTELPGILNWSLEGYDRLAARRAFVQPRSGTDAAARMALLGSSIRLFVEDRCELGDFEEPIEKLYRAWRRWAEDDGVKHNLASNHLTQRLRSVFPSLGESSRPRQAEPKRPRCQWGIRVKKMELW